MGVTWKELTGKREVKCFLSRKINVKVKKIEILHGENVNKVMIIRPEKKYTCLIKGGRVEERDIKLEGNCKSKRWKSGRK